MNFWVGIVFFCASADQCFFYKPDQVFSSQQACYKEIGKFHTKAEEAKAMLVRSNCLYVQVGKTVNEKR